MYWRCFSSLAVAFLFAGACRAETDASSNALAHDIFKELIEINTTESVGSVTAASEAMAKRLRTAGFPEADIQIAGPNDRKRNLVVRLHGTGKKKPILLIGHLDVVEARREDWTTDPFQLVEKDGYFFGRGTQDMKNGDAIMMTTLIRLRKEGFRPDRDLILALTADEESGSSNGVDWLLKNHRDLVDAAYALNPDAGGVTTVKGKPLNVDVEANEKLYADFELDAINPGGHSSLPVPDNAIYHIADALSRLEHAPFPVELNPITRAYFERRAALESGQTAADMRAILRTPPDAEAISRLTMDARFNSLMRTTCVATRLSAGHANNALPQQARANVNCRIIPGHATEEIRQELIRIFADPKVTVKYVDNAGHVLDRAPETKAFAALLPPPEVMQPLERVTDAMWPSAPVIPEMETGASDSVYTIAAGIPSYGVSGVALDQDDVRAHGKDERVTEKSFYDGVEFYYRYLKALTGAR
jgi:acetylornithine deacetylase/succinyl-diaminopimelate desuccinylase-like protein